MRVGVVGAGIMGHGIAQALACGGARVCLADRDVGVARAGKDAVERNLESLVAIGHLLTGEAEGVLSRITPVAHTAEAAIGVDLIVEAVPEVMSVKHAVLRRLSACANPATIIATNTSSFDIDALASVVKQPSRVVGTHFYNPAYLVPCVEVVPGSATSDETVQQVISMLRAAGKHPVLTANTAGFVGNRLQFALIAEAFRCVEEGVATAADIDAIVRTSFGMRLAEYAPFELADMGGLDTYQSILRYLAEHLGPRFTPPRALDRLVAQGRLGLKSAAGVYDYTADQLHRVTGERDRRLAQRVSDDRPLELEMSS
jgi:3-hydroxybutyryl-CoA dehydrogenase